MLRQIADWGFDIGLHFDPTTYGDADQDKLQKRCEFEASILADVTGQPVRSVSLHNPSVHGQYPIFDGLVNAYDQAVFTPDIYLSDSRMTFRHDPYVFVDRASGGPVQVLLHPIHYSDSGSKYDSLFEAFLRRFVDELDDEFRVNDGYCAAMPIPLRSHVAREWNDREQTEE